MGFDYSYAFANAKIALFDDAKGAEIEFSAEKNADKQKLAARYAAENGLNALLRALKNNQEHGVLYHYKGKLSGMQRTCSLSIDERL